MKCKHCRIEFKSNSANQVYCSRRCKDRQWKGRPRLQRTLTDEESYRQYLYRYEDAKEALAAERKRVGSVVAGRVETAHVLEVAMANFDEVASANAKDVTRTRVVMFLDYIGWDFIHRRLGSFIVELGFTGYDGECILAVLRGEPRPVVVESDRAVSPYNIMGFELGDDPDL